MRMLLLIVVDLFPSRQKVFATYTGEKYLLRILGEKGSRYNGEKYWILCSFSNDTFGKSPCWVLPFNTSMSTHFHSAFFLWLIFSSLSTAQSHLRNGSEVQASYSAQLSLNCIAPSLFHLPFKYCNTSHWIGMLVTEASLQFSSSRFAFLCFARVCPSSSSQVALLAPHPSLPFNCSSKLQRLRCFDLFATRGTG